MHLRPPLTFLRPESVNVCVWSSVQPQPQAATYTQDATTRSGKTIARCYSVIHFSIHTLSCKVAASGFVRPRRCKVVHTTIDVTVFFWLVVFLRYTHSSHSLSLSLSLTLLAYKPAYKPIHLCAQYIYNFLVEILFYGFSWGSSNTHTSKGAGNRTHTHSSGKHATILRRRWRKEHVRLSRDTMAKPLALPSHTHAYSLPLVCVCRTATTGRGCCPRREHRLDERPAGSTVFYHPRKRRKNRPQQYPRNSQLLFRQLR